MKLTVKNFGPIHEGKNIDVSPMTIFVGPSNTGKSYMAVLIYSIMEVLGGERISGRRYVLREPEERIDLIETGAYKNQTKMFQQVDKLFYIWARQISDLWKKKIVYCFGEEGNNFLKKGNNFSVEIKHGELRLHLTSPAKSKHNLHTQKKKEFFDLVCKEIKDHTNILEENLDIKNYDDLDFHINWTFAEMVFGLFNSMLPFVRAENFQSHYLPAIRGGIMQSHRTLVSALIQRAPMDGLNEVSQIPLFTGVLSDFMQKLINIETPAMFLRRHVRRVRISSNGKKKKIAEIGKKIEHDLMEGNINIKTSDVRYPDFRYTFTKNERKQELPLMSASSMVSELAPVSLFLRHHVNLGDLFIIEEPEAHLHPAAQCTISGILARLVNAGVYVLLTTHSDYILEQISNYMHAADTKSKKYEPALKKEKISVYLFRKSKKSRHKNTVVKKIAYDPDMGIITEDHLEVSTALYNETIDFLERREDNDN